MTSRLSIYEGTAPRHERFDPVRHMPSIVGMWKPMIVEPPPPDAPSTDGSSPTNPNRRGGKHYTKIVRAEAQALGAPQTSHDVVYRFEGRPGYRIPGVGHTLTAPEGSDYAINYVGVRDDEAMPLDLAAFRTWDSDFGGVTFRDFYKSCVATAYRASAAQLIEKNGGTDARGWPLDDGHNAYECLATPEFVARRQRGGESDPTSDGYTPGGAHAFVGWPGLHRVVRTTATIAPPVTPELAITESHHSRARAEERAAQQTEALLAVLAELRAEREQRAGKGR